MTNANGVAQSSLTAIVAVNDIVSASVGSLSLNTTVAIGLCTGQTAPGSNYSNEPLPDGGCFPEHTYCWGSATGCCEGLFCDPGSNACQPVVPLGGACTAIGCAQGTCQGTASNEYDGYCEDCPDNCVVAGAAIGMECICGQCTCPPDAPYSCYYKPGAAYPYCCDDICWASGHVCVGLATCNTQTAACDCPQGTTACSTSATIPPQTQCCTSRQTCQSDGSCL